MRLTNTRAKARFGGRTLAAASLAGVVAMTGTAVAAQADTGEPPTDMPSPLAEQAVALEAVDAADVDAQREAVAERILTLAAVEAKVSKVKQLRTKIVELAKDQIGDRYSRGSSGPNAFDCSGLVAYVYRKAMGKELPHQSHGQYSKVKKIKEKEARPGDLVFFFRNGAHHVGVYIGGGKMVDARGVGRGVRVSPVHGSWYSRTLTGFGRVIAEPAAA